MFNKTILLASLLCANASFAYVSGATSSMDSNTNIGLGVSFGKKIDVVNNIFVLPSVGYTQILSSGNSSADGEVDISNEIDLSLANGMSFKGNKLGAYYKLSAVRAKFDYTDTNKVSDSSTNFGFGVGGYYNIAKNLNAVVDVTSYSVDIDGTSGEVDNLSINTKLAWWI